jgi:hypothetical protein
MHRLVSTAALIAATATIGTAGSAKPSANDGDAAFASFTRHFLDAYARGDSAAVMHAIDPKAIHVYGSDANEFFSSPEQVQTMMGEDSKLWGGTARFGPMQHVSVARDSHLATIFFDVPFSVASRPPQTVRFAMTWRKEGHRWLLVQSSNAVPTVGSSAAELLRGR